MMSGVMKRLMIAYTVHDGQGTTGQAPGVVA